MFIEELGWNRPTRAQPLQIAAGEQQYTLSRLAEKSGFQVFACSLASDDQLPDANTRLKIERQLTPLVAEHLLVFLTPTTQFWQWARREPNAPIKLFKETFTKGSSGERLAQRLEPLPDIDFNIRAGNTLVGFTDRAAVEAAFDGEQQGKLGFDASEKEQFNEEAEAAERAFEAFRLQQTKLHGAITPKDKAALRDRLKKLSDKLDVFLAHEYGVKTDKPLLFEAWRKSHQPFHWYTEFFGIIKSGGFDVVIGNPPYVEYTKVKEGYRVISGETLSTNNLFALISERARHLINSQGSVGRTFVMRKQYFYFKESKPIIDEIDRVLARHYGFTDEELDFIINYDIKYRMGRDGEE